MDKELCFIIEEDKLFLETTLVDYNNVPIFFVCKGIKEYYLVLCIDMNELSYYVTKVDTYNLFLLLHQGITMREAILKAKTFYEVKTGDEIVKDIVSRRNIGEIDISFLPEAGAMYEVLTENVEKYVADFDTHYLCAESFQKKKLGYGFDTPINVILSGVERKIDVAVGKVYVVMDIGVEKLKKEFSWATSEEQEVKVHEISKEKTKERDCFNVLNQGFLVA